PRPDAVRRARDDAPPAAEPAGVGGRRGCCTNEPDHAVSMIQLKNVPESVHAEVRRRAGQEGLTIRDYVLKLIEKDQRLPTKRDWLDRVTGLEPVAVSQSATEAVRVGREARGSELDRVGSRSSRS